MDRMLELTRDLGKALRSQTTEVGAVTTERLHDEVPEYYAVEFADYACLNGVLEFVRHGFEAGGQCSEHLPQELVAEAVDAARNGVRWEVVARSYHISHEVIWNAVNRQIDEWNLPRSEKALLLQVTSRYLFQYFDFMTTTASRLYESERIDGLNSPRQRSISIVRQILDGMPVPDHDLGYNVNQTHLAIVAWGRDPDAPVLAAARKSNCPVISIPAPGPSIWVWLGLHAGCRYSDVVADLRPDVRTYLALGTPQHGRAGFIQSHQQAALARSVKIRGLVVEAQRVVAYPDVAVEAVGLADETRAKAFIAHQLGPLAAGDSRSAKLRRTLRVYSDSGNNATIAARILGIAERTVRYRVRIVEDQLGGFGSGQMQEVALAVRLFDALERQEANRLLSMEGVTL
jgi:hypothetical protein